MIAFANPVVFSLFMGVVLFLALLEFNRMGLATEHSAEQWLVAVSGAVIAPLLHFQQTTLLALLLVVTFLSLALMFLFRFSDISVVHHRLGWFCFGLFYLPLLLGHLVLLRSLTDGQAWIFMTLFVIMTCDTFAYFVGSNFGRRKLYLAVSPNKSVEGAVGGLVGSVLAVLLASISFLPMIGLFDGILIGVLLGVVGQLGDLFESLLKRACGVKDSGNLIPGHGGILDRLDSLLFAFPVVFYLARFGYGG